jgi:hypothetical protein
MVPDQIIVREGDTKHRATVLETYEHHGTHARVAVQPKGRSRAPFETFVEVPDNPETPKYKLYCEDCGHEEPIDTPDGMPGDTELVGEKDVDCQHEGNAQLLKRIHEAKRPSHSPTITPQPA